MKCLGLNLTKVAKELCPKNYKTLLKTIKEEKSIEKYPSLSIVKLNDMRCQYHPKCSIYRFNTILIKIPMIFFCKNRKGLKFIENLKGLQRMKTLKKKSKVGSFTISDFR